MDHRLGPRWRGAAYRRGHVRNHVVKVRQELWVKERQDSFVEFAWISRRYHVVIPRVSRCLVPIKSTITVVLVLDVDDASGETMPTEIIEAVGTVAANRISKFACRRFVHQRGLNALRLKIPITSRYCGKSLLHIVGAEVLERADLIIHDALVMILVAFMRVTCVVRGDAGGKTRWRRPVVVLVVVTVLVVALI